MAVAMMIRWFGQSAFRLAADGATVVVDAFGDTGIFDTRGLEFDHPAIEDVTADLVLVTHQ